MNFSDLKRQAAMVVVGIMSFVVAPAVQALNQVTTNLSEPMNLQATVSTFDCTNNPGPWINFEGAVTLAGLDVQLVFRNNINKDVHTRVEDVQTVVGVTTGVTIRIPKQPSHPFEGGTGTGAGGNPWISIQLVDDNGKPLSGEVLLGRCVQGAFNPSVDFSASVIAQAIIETLDCTNNPGPHINVSGSMSVSPGVKARIIFRNQRADDRDGGRDAVLERVRVFIPQAAGAGRCWRQSVDFGPIRGFRRAAHRPRNPVGTLRPATAR